MSKIDELIEELCPDGVEYMALGDVCNSLKKGTLKQGELQIDGIHPVINSGREWYGFYRSYNNEANAFVMAARGEYAGFITYINTKFWAGGLCYPYRSKNEDYILTKFMFYYLKNTEKTIMDVLVARGSIPAINKSDVDKIQIPIPPLAIQQEIVTILDKFTKLQAELQAELQARKKQYE
ncbi:MAG TPA: restriction endonuclease subunit S, partial [Sedimentisphaerales bacterium]|nr:restriction endonuclease subunit S [Sedimentisphaerales bacterium]